MKTRRMSSAFTGAMSGLWLLGLLAVAVGSIPAQAQPCPRDRAMWIYQQPYDVVRDPDERAALFPFSESHGIKEFFLRVRFNCTGDTCSLSQAEDYRSNLRSLIKEAHERNIRVHALYDAIRDEARRIVLAANHNRARTIVRSILQFNNDGAADEKFDGIHLDVEPHTILPEYTTDTIGTIRQFLDMNGAVMEELAGQDLSYGVDVVEFWYPYWDERGQFVDRPELLMDYGESRDYPTMHLMNMVKAVTIMAYHRNPDTTIRKTRYAMEYAARPEVGAVVYIGVQTSPDRPPAETFGRGTRSEMEEALCQIDNAFAGMESLLGFSYFKYSSYRDMPE